MLFRYPVRLTGKLPSKLDYAPPPGKGVGKAVVFGTFGLLIGAFGCLMILFGCVGLYHAHQHPNYVTHGDDMNEAGVFLILGSFVRGRAIDRADIRFAC